MDIGELKELIKDLPDEMKAWWGAREVPDKILVCDVS